MGQGASGQLRSGLLGQLTDGIANDDRQNPTDFFFYFWNVKSISTRGQKTQIKKTSFKTPNNTQVMLRSSWCSSQLEALPSILRLWAKGTLFLQNCEILPILDE